MHIIPICLAGFSVSKICLSFMVNRVEESRPSGWTKRHRKSVPRSPRRLHVWHHIFQTPPQRFAPPRSPPTRFSQNGGSGEKFEGEMDHMSKLESLDETTGKWAFVVDTGTPCYDFAWGHIVSHKEGTARIPQRRTCAEISRQIHSGRRRTLSLLFQGLITHGSSLVSRATPVQSFPRNTDWSHVALICSRVTYLAYELSRP